MMLRVKGLNFSYDKKPTLSDIDLEFGPGEMVGLVGPNGSGKSTLLKCLNGILKPNSGKITLCGDDISDLDPTEVARRVGYVPQEMPERYCARVFDAVLMGRVPYLQWQPSEHDLTVTAKVMRALGLDSFSMKEVSHLSGGERQKVLIARALAQEPRVLLLDEPTSNLDLRHEIEVMDIVSREAQCGTAALISIHDLNIALRYCNRFIILKEGRIFASGGREIFTSVNITAVYDINVSVIENRGRTLVVPEYIGYEVTRDSRSKGLVCQDKEKVG